jgi:cbb3-type cytochrome oxidase maturation protein
MSILIYLIPIALFLGLAGLGAFIWSLKSGQYDDLEGAALRVLLEEDNTPDIQKKDQTGKQSTPKRH